VLCAAVLFPVWAIYSLAFIPEYNPAHLAKGLRSADIWAVLDLSGGCVALALARQKWWGRVLYVTFFVETVCHNLKWDYHILSRPVYYQILDVMFYAQASLFIALGGHDVGKRILTLCAGLRRTGGGVPAFLETNKALAHDRK